ncbi:MAG: VOC family protein [Rhizobiaceae bacterium]|nr:VOC family protein [Rhizobiaceae bacterium]
MKGINHLVIDAADLDALATFWRDLGFTQAPRAQHPFGTANTVIQLPGTYIELLGVTRPEAVPEPEGPRFSFAAFNRDYIARHDGFAMLVLDTEDAFADIDAWRRAGIRTYDRFEFSRPARYPDGREATIGFRLAHASDPRAPWLGAFACQHFAPDYFEQPAYMDHPNTACGVADVWMSGPGALDLAGFFATISGVAPVASAGRIDLPTRAGTIVLAEPAVYEDAFGEPPPHPQDGPHLAAVTVSCRSLDAFTGRALMSVGDRLVIPSGKGFGTAIGFRKIG